MRVDITFSVARVAPMGRPLARALAIHMMSGSTPECWQANISPVLPRPVWISSRMSSTPLSSQSSLSLGR